MTASKILLDKLRKAGADDTDDGNETRPLAQLIPLSRGRVLLSMQDASHVLNASTSPVEFLVSNGDMETGEDEDGMGGVRFHTALRLRELVHGAQVKVLRSANLESPGGAAFGPTEIIGYQVDCRKKLAKVRLAVGKTWLYAMLESVVVMDDWMDLAPKPSREDPRGVARKQRLKTIRALHYGLDAAGKAMGYMNNAAFTQRWPHGCPVRPPSVHRHTLATTARVQPGRPTSRGAR